MNGVSSAKEPKSFDRNPRNFYLAVDEIKLVRAINELTSTLEKSEKEEVQSARQDFIRMQIARLTEQL